MSGEGINGDSNQPRKKVGVVKIVLLAYLSFILIMWAADTLEYYTTTTATQRAQHRAQLEHRRASLHTDARYSQRRLSPYEEKRAAADEICSMKYGPDGYDIECIVEQLGRMNGR